MDLASITKELEESCSEILRELWVSTVVWYILTLLKFTQNLNTERNCKTLNETTIGMILEDTLKDHKKNVWIKLENNSQGTDG